MLRNLQAGIDVGSHRTRVVVAHSDKRSAPPTIIGTGSAPSRGVRDGYITSRSEAASSIEEACREAEKTADARIKKVLVGIGGVTLESAVASGSVIISRADSEVTDMDIQRVIAAAEQNLNLANKRVVHRFPLAYRLDGKEILGHPNGMRGVKLEVKVLFITTLAQHLDDLIAAVESTGREVEDVVAAPLGASIATLTRPQQTAGCVLADIGADTVSIAVFENEQITSLHVFQIGSTRITNDIALGLKIPLEDAEEVKRAAFTEHLSIAGGEEASRKQLEEIVEARLRDIFELVRAHLKKIGRDGLLPAGIVLTGGGLLEVATLEDLAKASLQLPARVVVPRIAPVGNTKSEKRQLDASWSVAAGVCLLGFNPTYASELQQPRKNLLKSLIRRSLNWTQQFLP